MYAFCDRVRSGEWKGVSGKPIKTVVSIGIGGSDLGPVMVYEALKPFADAGITARFVSNIDPVDLGEKTEDLDPETTLFVIVSKTFTTLETLTNARCARTWLWKVLAEQGVIDGSDSQNAEAIRKHFVAVSTALDLVEDFGIDPRMPLVSGTGLAAVIRLILQLVLCWLSFLVHSALQNSSVALTQLMNTSRTLH